MHVILPQMMPFGMECYSNQILLWWPHVVTNKFDNNLTNACLLLPPLPPVIHLDLSYSTSNVYKERMTEMVTDSICALLLELANYQTQVFEFVGGEHTSKNVMITAVKRTKKQTVKEQSELRTKLKALATLHGVVNHQLAKWMNVELSDNVPSTTTTTMKLSTKKMPPL